MNKKINLAIKVCCLTDDVIGEGSLAGILLCEKEKKNYDKTFQYHVFSIIVIIVFLPLEECFSIVCLEYMQAIMLTDFAW